MDSFQIPEWRCANCGVVVEIRIEESPREPLTYDYNDILPDGSVLNIEGQPVKDLQILLFCPCTYKKMRGKFHVVDNG
jgi:hypothetical protein